MDGFDDFGWGGSDHLPKVEDGVSVWPASVMACLYFDKHINWSNAYEHYPCIVTFRQDELEIAYREDGESLRAGGPPPHTVYRGKENGPGHYYLWNGINGSGKGKARMHLTKSNVLEGSWEEAGMRGMWLITLRRR